MCNSSNDSTLLEFKRERDNFKHRGYDYDITFENESFLTIELHRVKGAGGLVVEYAAHIVTLSKEELSFASISLVHAPQLWLTPTNTGSCVKVD